MAAQLTLMVSLLAAFAPAASAQVRITIDHNTGAAAASEFKFSRVPSPARDDAASHAKLTLIDGQLDSNGANLSALVDGMLPPSGYRRASISATRLKSRRLTATHGIRVRAVRSFISFMSATVANQDSTSRPSAASIRPLAAGSSSPR